jgi:membrane fusion protein, type I secretion system
MTNGAPYRTWSRPDAVPPMPPIGRTVILGLALAALFFAGFGGWAALAPLSSAAVAPGQVRVAGHRKTVQHLEGGIVRQILVHEGDTVAAGQVLLRLDDTQSAIVLAVLQDEQDELEALEARLLAERDGKASLNFPAELERRRAEAKLAEDLNGQERLFASRQHSLKGQLDILDQQKQQLEAEIDGERAQATAFAQQLQLARDEAAAVADLVRRGLAPKPRLQALQGQIASLEGSRVEQLALVARAEQAIGESRFRAADLVNQRANEVETELRDTEAKLAEVREKVRAAGDVHRRMEVIAPVAGRVVDLRVFTAGGVIAPGQPLLDIVPSEDALVVDARVSPTDIDVVRAGLPAQVALTAYKRRIVPLLDAEVIDVSADALPSADQRGTYYTASIRIRQDQLARLHDVSLVPGMPVDVMILTGKRTALDYLLGPILDSYRHAFRED